MSIIQGPNIVIDGLVMYLDAANSISYPGSGILWNDLSGKGRNFTLNVVSQQTYLGNNFQFQNQYGYIATGLDDDIQTDMTIECWYMPISMYPNCCDTVFGQYNFRFFHIGNYVYSMISVDDGAGTRLWTHPSFYIANDIWHHTVLCRRNFYSYIIWIDGVQMFNNATYAGLNLWSNKSDWYISGGNHPNVKIAICRTYNRGLSDIEIRQNYMAQKSRFGL